MALRSHKLGSDEVRRLWRDVMDEVVAGETVLVMRHGKPIAAVIPIDRWEAVKDELENYDDNMDFAKKVAAYRKGIADGTVERDPVWDRVLAEMDKPQ